MLYIYSMFIFLVINLFIVMVLIDHLIIKITFIILFIVLFLGLIKELRRKKISIELMIYIFGYFFFFIAPIFQINQRRFPNNLEFNNKTIIILNFFILIWYMIFFILNCFKRVLINEVNLNTLNFKKNISDIYFFISVILFIITFYLFKFDIFLGYRNYWSIINNQSNALIFTSLTSGLIFANLLFNHRLYKEKQVHLIRYLSSWGITIYYLSPFDISRYYLAFIIITFIYLNYNHIINPKKFLLLLILGICIIFPIMGCFRLGFSLEAVKNIKNEILNQFNTLNFDAYSEFMATLKYVSEHGIVYGKIFISSILFFIPRAIWTTKTIGGGGFIGEYLKSEGIFHFTNISNPLISEIYLNFGLLIFFISPFIIKVIIEKIEKNNLIYAIVLGYSIFILRGDMMSSFAYCMGSIFSIAILPKILMRGGDKG